MFDTFEKIRIISLPYRHDRRREMRAQLRKVGLADDPRVSFFDAVRPDGPGPFGSIGANGCFLSHLRILEDAGGRSVLILEDDCDFSDDARDFQLPADTDVFYGGFNAATRPDDLLHSDIVGSHCMGFSGRAGTLAAEYLRSFFADDFRPDDKAAREPGYDPEIRPPVDGAYIWFRRAHPELKTVFAQPPIAFQRPSRTDIGDLKIYDRLPVVRSAVQALRKLRSPRRA
jgi:glycosyl transferase, family 25